DGPRHLEAVGVRMLGDYRRARELYLESLAAAQSAGNVDRVATEEHNLGWVDLHLGDVESAEARLRRRDGSGVGEAYLEAWRGLVALTRRRSSSRCTRPAGRSSPPTTTTPCATARTRWPARSRTCPRTLASGSSPSDGPSLLRRVPCRPPPASCATPSWSAPGSRRACTGSRSPTPPTTWSRASSCTCSAAAASRVSAACRRGVAATCAPC